MCHLNCSWVLPYNAACVVLFLLFLTWTPCHILDGNARCCFWCAHQSANTISNNCWKPHDKSNKLIGNWLTGMGRALATQLNTHNTTPTYYNPNYSTLHSSNCQLTCQWCLPQGMLFDVVFMYAAYDDLSVWLTDWLTDRLTDCMLYVSSMLHKCIT